MRLSRHLLRLVFLSTILSTVSRLILILILLLQFLLSPLFIPDQIANDYVFLVTFEFRALFRPLIQLESLLVRMFFLRVFERIESRQFYLGIYLLLFVIFDVFVQFCNKAVWQLYIVAYEAVQDSRLWRQGRRTLVSEGKLAGGPARPSLHLDRSVELHFYRRLATQHTRLLFDGAALRLLIHYNCTGILLLLQGRKGHLQ